LTKSKQCWNLIHETTFVSMSVGLFAVSIFSSKIFPFSIISRTKWNQTLMCLVWEWWTWFFTRKITFWLSQWTSMCSWTILKSSINPYNQIAFLKTSITAMCFVLVVEKATIDCNVDLQLTSPLASINI